MFGISFIEIAFILMIFLMIMAPQSRKEDHQKLIRSFLKIYKKFKHLQYKIVNWHRQINLLIAEQDHKWSQPTSERIASQNTIEDTVIPARKRVE